MKKMYNTPEVEVFEFDAEIQMEVTASTHVPGGTYGPNDFTIDDMDPGFGLLPGLEIE